VARDSFAKRFLDTLGKDPEVKESSIPKEWRVPVFLGISAVSLVLLLLLLWLVVLPGVRSQQATAPSQPAPQSAPAK
jgi:hypothetical protein